MTSIVVPIDFFKAIGEKPPVIRVIWIKWLAEHSNDILNPDFVDKFHLTMKDKINLETIKEAYDFGIRFFDGGFTILDGKKEKKAYKGEINELVAKVINYLNQCSGATYTTSKPNTECIVGRINEGFTIAEFKRVIDIKCKQWLGTEQQKYLRPITLFQSKKFENYLNEPQIELNAKRKIGNIESLTNAANKAKEFFD